MYVDQDIQGVYELPVTFPVLASGTHTITLRPGIKINGIASTRINYPFFASSEYSLDLVPGKVDTLKPVTSYQDDAGFAWIEGFENPGMSLQATPSSDTLMLKYKEGAFEGDFSGLIRLDEAHDYFEATSVDAFDLPGGLTPSYLELNFKADSRFIVGLIANGIGTVEVLEILVVNPAEEWKKIYINLGATVSRQSGILDYNVLFRAGLESSKDEAEILIDNIKLVHY
ncbi:MAG TPA: hypothetical protein P5550_11460 [Bacteroidales bacterium]|nr:hypothetical protein [Bacteroidales bacterium]